jgi:ubiquinone/menaquinone biosynthesis C-methylase UbiE
MADQTPPRREHPSTYFVQDRSNLDEMTRLQIQDQMMTAGMGGVLPEQPDPTRFQRVLDVACGTGSWLIEAAKTYPTIQLLIGVDVSATMLRYARAQAEEQAVHDRVEFATMDALRMLEFPDEFFNLVNHRFAMSWLRTWDWPKLLDEYQRICKPGGVIRVTECRVGVDSTSSALTRLNELGFQAFYQSGHLFEQDRNGVINQLARLLTQHGVQDVQTRIHILHYRTALPFFRKWMRVPDDYEAIYQQALTEMQQPDFEATLELLTAWGTKSGRDTTHDFLRVP